MLRGRGTVRIPGDLTIVMSVAVDEARGDEQAVAVDDPLSLEREVFSDSNDDVAGDGDCEEQEQGGERTPS